MTVERKYLHDSSICLCVKSYVSLDNLPEILCLISYLKVSSFMWLFRSHYLAKVGQNWLNWQNCLNGDINKAPPSPWTQFAWQYEGWGKNILLLFEHGRWSNFCGDVTAMTFFLSDAIPMFFGHLLTLLLMRLFGLNNCWRSFSMLLFFLRLLVSFHGFSFVLSLPSSTLQFFTKPSGLMFLQGFFCQP